MQIKCGDVSHVFKAQAYVVNKPLQFEEAAVFTITADTMKSILGERNARGSTVAIGRFIFAFSDDLAYGIKKLMK